MAAQQLVEQLRGAACKVEAIVQHIGPVGALHECFVKIHHLCTAGRRRTFRSCSVQLGVRQRSLAGNGHVNVVLEAHPLVVVDRWRSY